LRTEYIRIRYANASELFALFQGQQQQGGAGNGNFGGGPQQGGVAGAAGGNGGAGFAPSILSERGRAIVDDRTNSIILTDTEEKIVEFKTLIERVDVPIPQVMIEARIVVANNDFRRELGVRIAGDAVEARNGKLFEYTGSLDSVYAEDTSITGAFVDSDGDGSADRPHVFPENSLVDLGVFGPAGSIATNLISSNFFVGLELSALEDSGFAEIVSQPKVITGDKQQATIESGQQVPFATESLSGGTTITFVDAVLKLDVTPQITPDDRVIMDLIVNQDTVSGFATNGAPILDVTQLETQVLVQDGETIVLGGIYTTELVDGVTKVPLLGDIPFVGRLFKRTINSDRKREILIFITPKILSNNVSG
jgi:type IV pilus assembly protein PilQ